MCFCLRPSESHVNASVLSNLEPKLGHKVIELHIQCILLGVHAAIVPSVKCKVDFPSYGEERTGSGSGVANFDLHPLSRCLFGSKWL
jgi:hypothetical protein